MNTDLKTIAERYLRGLYGGDPSVVNELASEDIISSYPIFEQLFGTPTIRGREAMVAFSVRFAKRWGNQHFEIFESLQDSNKVVLVWVFEAQRNDQETDDRQQWGGITFFRFNRSGQITEEIGEESSPGPVARLTN
jgi:predicted SnoaL-like aldol condensation-catalyzing enzyme